MNKRRTYIHLMSKKMRRTVLRSPLQFLTMVLILALGSTLFSGLYASHLVFNDQVNRLYKGTKAADIYTTLMYDYDNIDDIQKEVDEDASIIKDAISDAGKVEAQYNSTGRIHGIDANISISDNYPTINVPYNVKGEKDQDDYFFLFDTTYLNNPTAFGEKSSWIDEKGNYLPIEIQLNINGFHTDAHKDVVEKLNSYLKLDGGKNLLDSNYLNLTVVPTGNMDYVENAVANSIQSHTTIASRKFIKTYLEPTLSANYNIAQLEEDIKSASGDEKILLEECLSLVKFDEGGHNELMDRYWCNNRYTTLLNSRSLASKYQNKIDEAFEAKLKSDRLLFNVKLNDTVINQQISTDVIQSLQLCYVFPPIFFLVAVLIVLTTISQIILKERKEIGTLKAIGVSNRAISAYYMSLTSVISLIGVAIGLVVGPLTLPTILNFKFNMLYNLPKSRYIFPTMVAIIMSVVILIITTLVAYLITRKEAKALPVTSMRPKPVNIKKKNISESKEDNTHKLCFKMAVRNIFCSIPRSIMVIVGVLGCTALLCCGFGVDDSIQRGIDNDVSMFFNADSLIYFSNPTDETLDQLTELTDKGTLTAVEPYGYLPTTSYKVGVMDETFATMVYSISPHLERENKFFHLGYEPLNNYVGVSNKIAKELNVHEGDYINFNFLGKTYTGVIGKVIDIFYMHGIFVDWEFYHDLALPTCAYARFNKDLNKNDVMDSIRNVPGVSNIIDKKALTKTITDVTSSISYITLTIKIFAILLAVVALYNLALLNFKENTRNIATMKVLGFNRREVAESLFFEIILLSAVGALVGLTLGYPLTRLTLGINQVPMCEFFYYISALSILGSLLITLGVTSVINLFVGLRSKQVKMVESLKSVE